jgi:hypothetical protein
MTEETAAKYIKNQLKSSIENEKMEELTRKIMNGQFSTRTLKHHQQIKQVPGVVMQLRSEGETESLIIAAQNQALDTRYDHRNIMSNKYRVNAGCAIKQKNTIHIAVGCKTVASYEYTYTHNKVAGNLYKPGNFHLRVCLMTVIISSNMKSVHWPGFRCCYFFSCLIQVALSL